MNVLPQRNFLENLAEEKCEEYQVAKPFPNIVFNNFFDEDSLNSVLSEFPDLSKKDATVYKNSREIKLQGKGELFFGDKTRRLMHFLNSEVFLNFLQKLTGIEEPLIGDPYFVGGGQHETKRGGLLKVHADFNKHRLLGLDRRINVLIYLNKDWKEEYGGHFELWSPDMSKCEKKVFPKFNTMAIFSTTDFSYHGLPDPISCPNDMSRKSLALYYYSNGRPASEVISGSENHGTLFKARENEASDKAALNFFNDPKRILRLFTPPIILDLLKKWK